MLLFTIVILAIHNLCLFRMQCKIVCLHSLFQLCKQVKCFFLTVAVYNNIICISLKRIGSMVFFHPNVKSIMQIYICKQGTNYSSLWRTFLSWCYTPVFLFYS